MSLDIRNAIWEEKDRNFWRIPISSPYKTKLLELSKATCWLLFRSSVPVTGHLKVTCGFLALAAVDVGEVVVAALRLTHTALSGQVTPREHAGRVGWPHILLSVSFPVLVPPTLWKPTVDTHTHKPQSSMSHRQWHHSRASGEPPDKVLACVSSLWYVSSISHLRATSVMD